MNAMAWRVGLFALVGVALALAALVGSTRWFAATEAARLRFDSSVYGLQVGAPVVFRGVRVGQVSAFGLAPLDSAGATVPVTAEFDRGLLQSLLGVAAPAAPSPVTALVQRGLVARLALQSVLTGQLYVELDIDPARAAAAPAAVATADALPVIPTQPTRLQTLQAQLQDLDLAQIGQDLALLARSARVLMAGPQPERALARTADAAQALERLALRLEQQVGPLAESAAQTLADTRRSALQVGQGAQQVGDAASAVRGQVRTLAQDLPPLTDQLRRTAEELAAAAATLREATADDSSLRLGADRALQDVSRAARALRELGETLDAHPDLLLRGRDAGPAAP